MSALQPATVALDVDEADAASARDLSAGAGEGVVLDDPKTEEEGGIGAGGARTMEDGAERHYTSAPAPAPGQSVMDASVCVELPPQKQQPHAEAGGAAHAACHQQSSLAAVLPPLLHLNLDDGCLICRSDAMVSPVTLGCPCNRVFWCVLYARV